MKYKAILLTAAFVTIAAFSIGAPSSCDPQYWTDPEALEELQRPPYARISVHSIVKYRHGEQTEATIPTYTKKEITVGTLWLTSQEIEHIDAVPRPSKPGYYDLELTLTDKGRREWIMLSNAHIHEDLAFIIDGVFYRSFRPRLLKSEKDRIVTIDGPFDQATAREIAYHSEFNYMKINRK